VPGPDPSVTGSSPTRDPAADSLTTRAVGLPLERFPASPGGVATNPLGGVENAINTVFEPLADVLTAFVFAEITVLGIAFPWIVAWLVVAAAIFTVYFGFVQFRQFRLATRVVRGHYTRHDEPGEITHFQALSSAVSGTVGLGNIAGVGVAVTIGGPGRPSG